MLKYCLNKILSENTNLHLFLKNYELLYKFKGKAVQKFSVLILV